MNSQIPRRRFYIGSAAIFWFVVAVVMWGIFFFKLRSVFKNDDMWWQSAWFFASYFSAPALLAALLAVLIRNLSGYGVLAWLITPPVWVFVSYIIVRILISRW
jgi:lysylphosphatidylglycerol synthetase-like protein (DUF2156 family)